MIIELKPKPRKISRKERRRYWHSKFILVRKLRINDTGPSLLVFCRTLERRWSNRHGRWIFRYPDSDFGNDYVFDDFKLV